MTTEPDINKIAASVIQGQINNALGAVSKGIKAAVTKVLDVIKKDLTKYTASKIKKCSFIRTPIINRDHSTHIYDIYVQTRLKLRKRVVSDDTFIASLSGKDSIIVSGNAGSGKSMFMRHLFLKLCNEKGSQIPLFFELRDINASEKKNLQEFLYYNLIGSNATITEQQFLDSLKAGVFCLVLDGFDEINHVDRKEMERQIIRLRDQCPDLQIIVSSRPDADRRLESWQAFEVVYVEPMDEQQAAELIERLEYDGKVKDKFLKEAKDRLFKTHKTFLSNPLLCIMMLVTFDQTGHIPTKRHVFFEKAFDALFSMHDTAKEGVYKRKTYSNLSVDEFRNCMSAFCIVTYLKEQFVFTRSEFREALSAALDLEKLSVNIDDLTSDMIESTCLVQIEGTDYVFTHRSFQEYFAAVFVCRSPAIGAKTLLDRMAMRDTDDVILLAFSINRGLVEREWVVPTLKEIKPLTADELPNGWYHVGRRSFGGFMLTIDQSGLPNMSTYLAGPGISLYIVDKLYPEQQLFTQLEAPFPKSELEVLNAAYNEMVLKKDERLKQRLGGGRRRKGALWTDRLIMLTDSDVWVAKISAPARLEKFIRSCQSLLERCLSEAQNQEDILAKLASGRYPVITLSSRI